MKSVLILGSRGLVGSFLKKKLQQNKIKVYTVPSYNTCDYINPDNLYSIIRANKSVDMVINCAGFTGFPNVDQCEEKKGECSLLNTYFPKLLQDICHNYHLPLGHISSGCIYQGKKEDGSSWTEDDKPNFTFDHNSSYYSGCKAEAEKLLYPFENTYIWRLRIPFFEYENPRNYITKILNYSKLLDAENSFSNIHDFCRFIVKCVQEPIPYGIYNVTNPGSITTKQVCKIINKHINRQFDFFESIENFQSQMKTPRSNCVLDTSKVQQYYKMPSIKSSFEKTIYQYFDNT